MKVKCNICGEEGEIDAEYGWEPFVICEGCYLLMTKKTTVDDNNVFYIES